MRGSVMASLLGFLGFLGASGCVAESAEQPPPTGPTYQYVVGEIDIPKNNTEARAFGLDLNKDGAVDNQLGMVFGTLNGVGFGVADTATEALVRGNAILLAELQTEAFDDTAASGLHTDLGANPTPAACADPTKLETCGRHLQTRAHYDVIEDGGSLTGVGPFEDGRFTAPVSSLPITIGIDPAAPLRIDLQVAKIQLTDASPDGATAIIAGGITKADLDAVVIPEVARNLARIVGNDCHPAQEPAPCGCPSGSRGALLQKIFDDDHDCTVTLTEVAHNSIIESLLTTDFKSNGEQMLSFGIGARLVPASY